ncbi:MAG: hypothetical protein AAFN16_01490 [Pseudomonadota bacterium]
MKSSPDLSPDCESCAALCCVVFAFDKSDSFGIDKAACEVCPNLDESDRCRIFETRKELGFGGCIAYDCHGAGQRVTSEVFDGRHWREDPGLKERMGAALSVMRRIHELLLLLVSARRFPLSDEETRTLCDLEDILNPDAVWTEKTLKLFPIAEVSDRVNVFLRSLKHHAGSLSSART